MICCTSHWVKSSYTLTLQWNKKQLSSFFWFSVAFFLPVDAIVKWSKLLFSTNLCMLCSCVLSSERRWWQVRPKLCEEWLLVLSYYPWPMHQSEIQLKNNIYFPCFINTTTTRTVIGCLWGVTCYSKKLMLHWEPAPRLPSPVGLDRASFC